MIWETHETQTRRDETRRDETLGCALAQAAVKFRYEGREPGLGKPSRIHCTLDAVYKKMICYFLFYVV